MEKVRIIIATIKTWNISNSLNFTDKYKDKYEVILFDNPEDLIFEKVNEIQPKYLFFPHWSWIIPKEIYQNFTCIVFHMTDLPFGRGGSPLQNLIIRKKYETKISAIKVEEGLDTGKIYLKENLYIGLGSAEEIFQKASEIIFNKLIPGILENKIEPYEQQGNVVKFKRRKPEDSNLGNSSFSDLHDIYDFIRMLDAEAYPYAFIEIDKFKVYFSEAHKKNGKVVGRFEITYET